MSQLSPREAERVMDITGQIAVALTTNPNRTPDSIVAVIPKLVDALEKSYLSLLGDDESPNKK